MKDFLKKYNSGFLLSSAVCILLGLILIIFSGTVLDAAGIIFGIAFMLIGAIVFGSRFLHYFSGNVPIAIGLVLEAIGLVLILNPGAVASMIPVVIGLLLIGHGFRSLTVALNSRKYGNNSWGLNIFLAICSLVFGLICCTDAFGIMEKALQVVGLLLIFNGISNIWISVSGSKARNSSAEYRTDDPDPVFRNYTYEGSRQEGDTIDTTFVEDRDKR